MTGKSEANNLKSNTSELLGTTKLFPLLMQMSIPSIIAMLVGGMYNIVDTIFVGHGAGTLALAGLSIAFPIQWIVMAFSQMIGIGATAIISLRLGEKRYEKAQSALGTAFTLLLLTSVFMSIITLVYYKSILQFFGASENTLAYACDYLVIVAWGFPVYSLSIAGANLIRAEGKAKTAMNTMLVGMVLNIILDPIFIFSLNMGIQGAAIATVISQTCSTIWILAFYLGKKSEVQIGLEHLRINWEQLKKMVLLGLPNFTQTAGMSILTLIINNTLLYYSGDVAIGIYGTINRLMSFVVMPVIGIGQGFQPIAGYNFGAEKFDRVKDILKISAISATVIAGSLCIIMETFPHALISLFSSDPGFLKEGAHALRLMASCTTLMGPFFIFSIYFQAVGKGIQALLLGLSRQFFILIPILLVLPRFLGTTGVWMSFPASDFISFFVTLVVLMRELAHLNERHEHSIKLAESFG